MNAKHVVVGGGAASIIVALVATLTKNHVHLTTDEAVFYGGVAAAVGTGVAHRIDQYGLRGLFRGLWSGSTPAA